MCRKLPNRMLGVRGGGVNMRYLILGASAAGINCAKTIRELDSHGEITMVSEDNLISLFYQVNDWFSCILY